MRADQQIVRDAAQQMVDAAEYACDALTEGRVKHEPEFTDRFLASAETRLNGHRHRGVIWRARTLTSKGKGAEEERLGADFVGLLHVELDDLHVSKGFLAQAKRVAPGEAFGGAAFRDLREQCEKMLKVTPASYVFLYSRETIRIVPAVAVYGVPEPQRPNPHELMARSVRSFFEAHFECFIGDQAVAVGGGSTNALDVLVADRVASSGLELRIQQLPAESHA